MKLLLEICSIIRFIIVGAVMATMIRARLGKISLSGLNAMIYFFQKYLMATILIVSLFIGVFDNSSNIKSTQFDLTLEYFLFLYIFFHLLPSHAKSGRIKDK